MEYEIKFHEKVDSVDLPKISKEMVLRILKDIRKKLIAKPDKFGVPLRSNLKGLRKMRIGDYGVVYQIKKEKIVVFVIIIAHRKDVYEEVIKRFS